MRFSSRPGSSARPLPGWPLVAQPAYLLAMKVVAMRLGEEFHDFDETHILPKTRLALEELLPG